jgi:alkylated DNA repair dioxygenase AlkB
MVTVTVTAMTLSKQALDNNHHIYTGSLPDELLPSEEQFERLWELHPKKFPTCMIYGREMAMPRWHQAFGRNHRFSGITREASPVNADLAPYLAWAHQAIDGELNGLLVNWFDGKLGHYIGKHRDSEIGIQEGSSYVTISFGETRILRLRKWKGSDRLDFPVENGSIAIIPYATNRAWTHEIPKSKRASGRRISVTMRAFNSDP